MTEDHKALWEESCRALANISKLLDEKDERIADLEDEVGNLRCRLDDAERESIIADRERAEAETIADAISGRSL